MNEILQHRPIQSTPYGHKVDALPVKVTKHPIYKQRSDRPDHRASDTNIGSAKVRVRFRISMLGCKVVLHGILVQFLFIN